MSSAERLLKMGLLVVGAASLLAQTADPRAPAFEVVSIKPNHSGAPNSRWRGVQGEDFITLNVTPAEYIASTYTNFRYFEIFGFPEWAKHERYDVIARLGDHPDRVNLGEKMVHLLEDRFMIKVHREQREVPLYELLLAKSDGKFGPNLEPVQDGECDKANPCHGFFPQEGPNSELGKRVNMEQIASLIGDRMGARVIDKTGVAGVFNLKLERVEPLPAFGIEIQPNPDLVSITTAIQEQLGLKVRRGKTKIEVLVIDHLERPSEN